MKSAQPRQRQGHQSFSRNAPTHSTAINTRNKGNINSKSKTLTVINSHASVTTILGCSFLFLAIITIISLAGLPSGFSRRVSFPLLTSLGRKMSGTAASASSPTNPMMAQPYKLLQKTKLSPDSYLLEYEIQGRPILGNSPNIPTCVKVEYPGGTNKKGVPKILSKSYSPVSHPKTEGKFELVVKSYEEQPGGGVGKFICDMTVGDSITGTLKKERVMHGSTEIEGRWKQVGLVAGGTGIAPLLQIARILLESPQDKDTKIYLLFLNRHESDILGKDLIDQMAKEHPNQFFVTYALTGDNAPDLYEKGRGTVELAKKALPSPTNGEPTMIFVCGKDGFVEYWGGPVIRGPKKPDGSKGPKIQGPLEGILKEAGFSEDQVFKY